MSEDYHPKDKSDLLRVIKQERVNLEALLEGLNDHQMVESGVEAHWSIKDILAHIAAWERVAQDRINAAFTGEPTKIELIEGGNFVDLFNADVYESNKNIPLNDIQEEFHTSYQAMLDQIGALDDEFLKKPLPFDWAGDLTAQVLISANTHWHYIEHARSIQMWLGK